MDRLVSSSTSRLASIRSKLLSQRATQCVSRRSFRIKKRGVASSLRVVECGAFPLQRVYGANTGSVPRGRGSGNTDIKTWHVAYPNNTPIRNIITLYTPAYDRPSLMCDVCQPKLSCVHIILTAEHDPTVSVDPSLWQHDSI